MTNKTWLVVGLGNSGANFNKTRHNAGFLFLDYLIPPKTTWQNTPNYTFCEFTLGEQKIICLKPQTMMNLSGIAVKAALKTFQVLPTALIVVCDNSDLVFGTAKSRLHLSSGGHNGLKNIENQLNNQNIKTIHLGIGRQNPLHQWVLSRFQINELTQFEILFKSVRNHLDAFFQTAIAFEKKWNLKKTSTLKSLSKPRRLVVVGGQFGDEGKGKVVDYYAAKFDIIARFSGGDNAGHTVKIADQVYQFSILPVAMIRPDKISFLGAGCLINLEQLCRELTALKKHTAQLGQLKIAARAHLILPYHLLIDQQEEAERTTQIGTTKRGIGPCMSDKVNRIGIQVSDLFDPAICRTKLTQNLKLKNPFLKTPLSVEPLLAHLIRLFTQIRACVVDSVVFWEEQHGKNVLFEGSQGTLLDPQYGFYPFVTSTPTLTWQASLGTNTSIQKATFLGVFKSYVSRVGAGPLPTFITDSTITNKIVTAGHEYGVVTKRQRRIGWFDVVLARYAMKVNNFHQIALTLLDVLTVCDQIKICTHYLIRGKRYDYPPVQAALWAEIEPQYITLSGWNQTDFSQITTYQQLPQNARTYVTKIEELLGTRIVLISIGKERKATIQR